MVFSAWIGPAIIAARISGVIGIMSLYFGSWISIRLERRRRVEKIRDFQVALRAEIRSELNSLRLTDFEAHFAAIELRYRSDANYRVRPTLPARHRVFEAIVGELHLLPEAVIDEIVLYTRQRAAIEAFVQDMRDEAFSQVTKEGQIEMYRDLTEMQIFLAETAERSIQALDLSLGTQTPISNRASGQSVRK